MMSSLGNRKMRQKSLIGLTNNTSIQKYMTIKQLFNSSNSLSAPELDMDEFLPVVRFKKPSEYSAEGEKLAETDKEASLSTHLDIDKRKYKIWCVNTEKRKLKLPFTVKKGAKSSWDDNGKIYIKISTEDADITVSPESLDTKYGEEFELSIEAAGEVKKDFYVDFYANDDKGDWNTGEYEDVHCGRIKIRILRLQKVYYAISLMSETDYRSRNLRTFRSYVKVENQGFNSSGLGNYLATESENLANNPDSEYSGEEIRYLAIFSHGIENQIWGDGDSIGKSNISSMFSSESIHFSGDAVIFLGACNGGTGMSSSFAQELANTTGVTVISMADDGVAPVKESKWRASSPEMSYGPKMGKLSMGKFYKFTKGGVPVEIGKTVDIIELLDTQKASE